MTVPLLNTDTPESEATVPEPTRPPVASAAFLHELAIRITTLGNITRKLDAAFEPLQNESNEVGFYLDTVDELLRTTAADLLNEAEFLLALRAKSPTPPTPEQVEASRIVLLSHGEREDIRLALEGDSNDAEHDVLVDLANANDIEYHNPFDD